MTAIGDGQSRVYYVRIYYVQVAEGGAILVRPDGHVGWRCLQPLTAPQRPQQGLPAPDPKTQQQQPVEATGDEPHHRALQAALRHMLCARTPAADRRSAGAA